MLTTPAPFPHPGSWALVEVDGAARAAKVISSHRDGTVTIALDGVPGASGNRRIPAAELRDPTPLTLHEEGELHRLERDNARRKRPSPASVNAETKLRRRLIDSTTFEALRAIEVTRKVA
jgi:hypothetical protein